MKEKEFEKYILQNSWYHGTTLQNWKRICRIGVKHDYNIGLESDFGYGFYLSPKYKQAESYITRMIPYIHGNDMEKIAVVIEFQLNVKALIEADYKYKRFLHFDREFAEFVAECRLNPMKLIHDYDFIIGVMSDSNSLKLIDDYSQDMISIDDVINGLIKWNSMEQISIHNQKICDMLSVKRVYNLTERKEEDVNDYNKRFL